MICIGYVVRSRYLEQKLATLCKRDQSLVLDTIEAMIDKLKALSPDIQKDQETESEPAENTDADKLV